MLIPLVNVVFVVSIYVDLAKSFGRHPAFAVGLLLLAFVFYPILEFGGARYSGALGLRQAS